MQLKPSGDPRAVFASRFLAGKPSFVERPSASKRVSRSFQSPSTIIIPSRDIDGTRSLTRRYRLSLARSDNETDNEPVTRFPDGGIRALRHPAYPFIAVHRRRLLFVSRAPLSSRKIRGCTPVCRRIWVARRR